MHRTRNNEPATSRLGAEASVVLRTLYQVGEASNVSPLKGVAGIGSLVMEQCILATRNQEEARLLSETVFDLLKTIGDHLYQHRGITPSLQVFLEELAQTLRDVGAAVKPCLEKRSFFKRLTGKADADFRVLRVQADVLQYALSKFQSLMYIEIRKSLVSQKAQLNITEEQLRTYFKTFIADLGANVRRDLSKAVPAMDAETTPAAFELHHPSPSFYGREVEVADILTTLKKVSSENVAIAILGPGGIGKTSLAKHILFHQEIQLIFDNRRYFVSCEADISSDGFLTSLTIQLGLKGPQPLRLIIEFLKRSSPILLVLDNFETPWDSPDRSQVEEHLITLSSVQGVALIVTMRGRERPSNVGWTRPFLPALDRLEKKAARQLFFAENDCDHDAPAVDELLEKVDYVPLAVSLLSPMAQWEEPANLLKRYEEESTSMLWKNDDRNSSVDVSVRLSLQCKRMENAPMACEILSALAVLPDGLSTDVFEVVFKSQKGARKALATLKQTALVYTSGDRIRILAPIRQYMLRHHPPPLLLRFLLETYATELAALSSKMGTSAGKETGQKLLPEIGNITAVVSTSLWEYVDCEGVWRDGQSIEEIIEAAINLTRIYRYTSRGSKKTCDIAIEAAKKANLERLRAEATYVLAQLYHRHFADHDKAEELTISAIEIYSQLDDLSSMAECYHLRGSLASVMKKPRSEAMIFYERGLRFAEKSVNERCEAKCLSSMSEIKTYMGCISEGIDMSERAFRIFKKLGDYVNMAFTTYWLGRTAEQRSQFATAKRYYEESMEYFIKSGSQRDIARPLNQLGDIAYHQCDYVNALKHLNGALEILKELGEENLALASFVVTSRAFVYIALYDLEKATLDAERAMSNFERMKFDYGIIQCHICFGDIAYQRMELSRAETSYLEAAQMAERRKQNTELGLARRQLARLWLRQGKLDEALQICTSAQQTYESISDLHGKANCMQILGDISLAMGNTENAETSYLDARHFLQHVGAMRGSSCCLLGLGKIAKSRGIENEASRLLGEAENAFLKLNDTNSAGECRRVLNEPWEAATADYTELVEEEHANEAPSKTFEKKLVLV